MGKAPSVYILFCIKDQIRFVCDLTELPLINTHIKCGLDQFVFQYQDDGRLDMDNNHFCDHLIRARLPYRGVIEFSDRIKINNKHIQINNSSHSNKSAASMLATIMNIKYNQNEPGSSWKRKHNALIKKLEPLQGSFRMNDVMTISFLHHYK